MTDLKTHLTELFKNKNPKSYVRMISSNQVLMGEIYQTQQTMQADSVMETIWCILNNTVPQMCACGKKKQFDTFVKGYRQYCNMQCPARKADHSRKISEVWKDSQKLADMTAKRKRTCLTKYGFENAAQSELVKQKTIATNLVKYGAPTPLESQIVQDKIKQRMVDAYGVEYPFQSEEIRKKSEETFSKNHPDVPDKMSIARAAFINEHQANPFALKHIQEKLKETRLKKYGYAHALQSHLSAEVIAVLENRQLFIDALRGLTLAEASVQLGVNPTTVARRAKLHDCREIFSVSGRSKWEFIVRNFLLELGLAEGIDFVQSDRSVLQGKELDFYFPKIKAALEVGSVFWHSEINAGRGEQYHYNKWKLCTDAGISLLQYWDYELENSWDVIASKIRYLFKKIPKTVGARLVKDFATVPLSAERDFLNKFHIQKFSGDRTATYGAYCDGVLVAVMALATRRHGVEIVRYATDLTSSYPGLFSKLLKFSLTAMGVSATTVFSYSDNRHSSGTMYKISGFGFCRNTDPTYLYTRDYHIMEHKKRYTKQKIKNKFGVDITNRTEWQLMQELGYDRIWDAGKILWKKDYTA